MNNYVLEGTDSFLAEEKMKQIIEENHFSDYELHRYDLQENTLDEVLEDLDTYSFLTKQKVIVLVNSIFFTSASSVLFTDAQFKHLLKYLENPNPDHLLILQTNKVTTTLKNTKGLLPHLKHVTLESNPRSMVKTYLEGYEIQSDALRTLLDYCQDDIGKLYQECEKLKNYKYEDKKITQDDVVALVTRKIMDSDGYVFELTNSLVQGNKERTLEVYRDLLALNNDPIQLLGLVASQYKTLYQVKVLTQERLSDQQIATELNMNPYRIKKVKESLYNYSLEELANILTKLADVDLSIKKGTIDSKLALELFLLEY